MRTIPTWMLSLVILVALVGFADAAYLTAEHYRGVIPPCTVVSGCETVLSSSYSVILGVPVSVLGLLYYGGVLILTIAYVDTGKRRLMRWFSWLAVIGFAGTLYFLVIQAFVLNAFCPYCLGSALTSTLLLIAGVRMLRIE